MAQRSVVVHRRPPNAFFFGQKSALPGTVILATFWGGVLKFQMLYNNELDLHDLSAVKCRGADVRPV